MAASVEEATKRKMRRTRKLLVGQFGQQHDMRRTTQVDAEDFIESLRDQALKSNSTIRKHTQIAAQIWNQAIEQKLCEDNPFDGFTKTVKKDPARFFKAKLAVIRNVIDACPDNGWRLVFGLTGVEMRVQERNAD